MQSYRPPRDRDARATIRGYVYQAELTIARWLELEPGQILELEHGEDIDLVAQAITTEDEYEQYRLLEQVKHREQTVTLKTSAAISAIVNFYEHRLANPDMPLLFRYTTNALVGRERRSPMPGGMAAIDAWEQIRGGALKGKGQIKAIEGIRRLLLESRCPEDIPEESWKRFQNHLQQANQAQLLEFIRTFEWSTGTRSVRELRQELKRRLIEKGFAADPLEADEQYLRLFLHVFEVLSSHDSSLESRQLHTEELEQLITLPTLSITDHALLNTIREVTKQHELELQLLTGRVSEVEEGLENVREQVHGLLRDQRLNIAVDYVPSSPVLDVPLLGHPVSGRTQIVGMLKRIVTTKIWTAIHGGASTGKTTLAILLAQELGTCKAWIRLGPDYSIDQACVQLDEACKALMNEPLPAERQAWYERMAVQVGQHALVVLDDLPQLSGRDGLSVRLQQLVRAFRLQGVHLLSLSTHELPSILRRSLHQQALHTWAIEPFSQSEVADLLRSYGAPENIIAEARSINTLALRHPPFVEAIARYLEHYNWQFDEQVLSALFQQKYAVDIREETQRRLLATVEDGHTRDLLYRLAIILGDFSFDAVRILAEVEPVLDHPRERLITLTGPWIERERHEYYRLSPLIRSVGTDDLSHQTKRDCNRVLAEQLLSTGSLHIAQALSVLNYLLNAEEYNRTGLFTISVLLDIQRQVHPVEDYGFISLWANDPIPAQMDLGIRLYLRGVQFDLLSARGYDTAYLEGDMKALLAQTTTNETWAILAVWTAVRGRVPGIHLALLSALRYWSQALLPNGKPLASVFSEDMHPESLIWVSASEVETIDQLHDWIETVGQLTEDQRRYTFNEPYAEAGCMHIVDSVWHKEAEKPKEQQDWAMLLSALDNIANRASNLQLELLWVCAIRAQVMVIAEYDQDLTGALAKAEEALLQASSDPRIQFLLRECMGRQLLYAHREQEAGSWLQQALDESTPAYPYEHMAALLCLSRAIGSDDPQQAAAYTEEAVRLAETSPAIGDIALVKALGEEAIALWMIGERQRAFDGWDRAADVLLACRSESDEWKGLYVLFGHLSGYFTSMTQTGQPPARTSSGEPYEPPRRGLFFTNHPIRAHLYDQARDSFLMVLLTQFAEAVGRDDRAAVWAQRGIELSREAGQTVAYYQMSAEMLPYLVLEHRYAEALDIALEAGMISVALREQRNRGGDVLERNLEITELLGAKSSIVWQHAEYQATQISLLPTMFSLGLIAMYDPDQASMQAEEVVALCRDIGGTASDQILWNVAAQLIEQTFVTTRPMSEWHKTLDSLRPNEYDVLHALTYLGASLQQGFSLDTTCQLHAMTLAYMEKAVYQSQSTGYRRLVSPFFTTYWLTKFAQQRFRFRMPATIDAELQDAQHMPESRRARAILWTVASGLGINLAESGLQAP